MIESQWQALCRWRGSNGDVDMIVPIAEQVLHQQVLVIPVHGYSRRSHTSLMLVEVIWFALGGGLERQHVPDSRGHSLVYS